MLRRPFFEKGRKLRIAALTDNHLEDHDLVAHAAPPLNAFAAQPQLSARIRPLRYRHRYRPGDRRHRNPGAEHRLGEADRQIDENIVAVAAEQRMRRDVHFDQRVASRSAAKARTALAAEPQYLTILDPGRDRHVEPFLRGERQALLAAGCGGGEIDGQREMAVAAAGPKSFAGLPSPPTSGRAKSGEQILEVAEIHFALGLISATLRALGISPIAPLRPLLAGLIDFPAVVARPLFGIGEQVVGRGDRLEPRFRLGFARVEIGVELLCEFAIDVADLIGAGVGLDAQHLIGSLRHPRSALPQALALRRGRRTLDPDCHVALAAAAHHRQLDLVADARQADAVAQIAAASHRRAVDRDDDVIGPQSSALGRRAGLDAGDYRSLGAPGVERQREIGGQVLDRDADAPVPDLTVIDQLVHDAAGHVDRDGEADPDIDAGGSDNCGVDADDPALQVDERPAGVTRIDRSVGLDEVLVAFDPWTAPGRTDDPRGHGLSQTERIADRQHKI